MKRFGAVAFLIAGLFLSGCMAALLLVFAGAAAGNSGQTSLYTGTVLPISIGVLTIWLITSSVLFWHGRDGWSAALAWGPALLIFVIVLLSN